MIEMPRYEESKKLIAMSKVYQRGKAQIPSEIRKILELRDGDKICFFQDEEGNILIEKSSKLLRVRTGRYLVRETST